VFVSPFLAEKTTLCGNSRRWGTCLKVVQCSRKFANIRYRIKIAKRRWFRDGIGSNARSRKNKNFEGLNRFLGRATAILKQ
jgi:hypothetical protein